MSLALNAVLVLGLCLTASAATWRVGSGDTFSTINGALEAAAAGDTILVAAGKYHENLVISRAVTLIGEGRPEIVGQGSGDVILVEADDVEVRGFRVSGSGRRMMVSDAGIKIAGARARIIGNHLIDNLFGIYLKACTEALIDRNVIRGRPMDGIGQRGAGIHFFDAHHNVVRFNEVSLVRDGVYFDHADFNRVEDNEFSDLRYGVHYMYCKDNSFSRNVFRDSMAGVAVMYTERVVFRDNQILNNRAGYNAFGLLFKDCLDSVAERNVIVNNVRGIFLDASHGNRFRNNLVAYNDVGVVLHASSLNNTFGGNDFVGNQATLHTVGRADADWTPDGIGNYYTDYYGYDLDGDGIGDTEHRLQDAFEYLRGSRPLLSLFLNSAAADALSLAEQSFPLIPGSDERDAAPRMKPVSGVQMTYRPGPAPEPRSPWASGGSVAVLLFGGWLTWRLRG
ncbi:MAG: nitrous oxide reductase family maturation protein NosD [bacterium]|nr:nitrous oxide reductase family maturation protein NosD [bacterium]